MRTLGVNRSVRSTHQSKKTEALPKLS
uniref:Uncharacterized protein n=1 Tax=Rhizophora mucronata TaxID=61149 RepID=A0A2P2QWJ9_RHIMU